MHGYIMDNDILVYHGISWMYHGCLVFYHGLKQLITLVILKNHPAVGTDTHDVCTKGLMFFPSTCASEYIAHMYISANVCDICI